MISFKSFLYLPSEIAEKPRRTKKNILHSKFILCLFFFQKLLQLQSNWNRDVYLQVFRTKVQVFNMRRILSFCPFSDFVIWSNIFDLLCTGHFHKISQLQGVSVQKVMFQLTLAEKNIQFDINSVSFSWSWIAEISARWIILEFFNLMQPQ